MLDTTIDADITLEQITGNAENTARDGLLKYATHKQIEALIKDAKFDIAYHEKQLLAETLNFEFDAELGNPAYSITHHSKLLKQARYRLERLTKALDAKGPDFEGRSFEIDELQSPEMIANASWKDTGDDMTPDECIALSEYLGRDVIEPMWYSRNEGGE